MKIYELSELIKVKPQNTECTCGPACIMMVLNFFKLNDGKKDLNEKDIEYLMKTNPSSGTKTDNLLRLLKHFNLRTKVYNGRNGIKAIKEVDDINTIGIILVEEWGEGHFIIAEDLYKNKNKIKIADPYLGKKYDTTLSEIVNKWYSPEEDIHGWICLITKEH